MKHFGPLRNSFRFGTIRNACNVYAAVHTLPQIVADALVSLHVGNDRKTCVAAQEMPAMPLIRKPHRKEGSLLDAGFRSS
jgi:hypothetical protein